MRQRIGQHSVSKCSAATDDAAFGRATVVACAYWALKTLQWYLEAALELDDAWKETRRLWLLARLQAFVETTEEFGFFLALASDDTNIDHDAPRAVAGCRSQHVPYFPAFVRLSR